MDRSRFRPHIAGALLLLAVSSRAARAEPGCTNEADCVAWAASEPGLDPVLTTTCVDFLCVDGGCRAQWHPLVNRARVEDECVGRLWQCIPGEYAVPHDVSLGAGAPCGRFDADGTTEPPPHKCSVPNIGRQSLA